MTIEPGRLYMVRTNTTLRLVRPIRTTVKDGVYASEEWYCDVIWPLPQRGKTFRRYIAADQLELPDIVILGRAFQDLAMLLQDTTRNDDDEEEIHS